MPPLSQRTELGLTRREACPLSPSPSGSTRAERGLPESPGRAPDPGRWRWVPAERRGVREVSCRFWWKDRACRVSPAQLQLEEHGSELLRCGERTNRSGAEDWGLWA